MLNDIKISIVKTIEQRKADLDATLKAYNLPFSVEDLKYLHFDESRYQTPYDAGCRMMILYGLSYVASNPEDRRPIKGWFKREQIWMHLSTSEKEFLAMERITEKG